MVALIHSVVTLHRRFLPGQPGGRGPNDRSAWGAGCPFFVPPQTQTWFAAEDKTPRLAVVCHGSEEGTFNHAVMAEAERPVPRPLFDVRALEGFLFPFAFTDPAEIPGWLGRLRARLAGGVSLIEVARECAAAYARAGQARRALVLVGGSAEDLRREVEWCAQGWSAAWDRGQEWRTPSGSCLASRPLGREAGVAFVYPGAGSVYVGAGRDLLQLFPGLTDRHGDRDLAFPGRRAEEFLLFPRGAAPVWRTSRRGRASAGQRHPGVDGGRCLPGRVAHRHAPRGVRTSAGLGPGIFARGGNDVRFPRKLART